MGICTRLASLGAAKRGEKGRSARLRVGVSKEMFATSEVSVLMWAKEEMAACLHAVWRDLTFWWMHRSKVVSALWYHYRASFSMVSAAGCSRYLGREEGEEENGFFSALLLSHGSSSGVLVICGFSWGRIDMVIDACWAWKAGTLWKLQLSLWDLYRSLTSLIYSLLVVINESTRGPLPFSVVFPENFFQFLLSSVCMWTECTVWECQ